MGVGLLAREIKAAVAECNVPICLLDDCVLPDSTFTGLLIQLQRD